MTGDELRDAITAALDTSIDRCARCKVCDTQIGAAMTVLGPLLERAEAAEAKLARVEELARQLITATHPTIGGTFAAGIGHKFLAVIGTDEETS